jgi:hypothetical protein
MTQSPQGGTRVRVDQLTRRDVEVLHTSPATPPRQVVKVFRGLSVAHLEVLIAQWQEGHPEYDVVQISLGEELRALILFELARVRM